MRLYSTDDVYAMLDAEDRLERVLGFVSSYHHTHEDASEALASVINAYRAAVEARARVCSNMDERSAHKRVA